MAETHTVGDIVMFTGARERTVLLWADAGALLPEPATQRAGRGVHRRFRWREVEIAAVLAAVAPFRLPIGVMVQIGAIVRAQLVLAVNADPAADVPDFLQKIERMGAAVEAARRGESSARLILTPGNMAKPDEPFSIWAEWSADQNAGASTNPNKVALFIDLAECWRSLIT